MRNEPASTFLVIGVQVVSVWPIGKSVGTQASYDANSIRKMREFVKFISPRKASSF